MLHITQHLLQVVQSLGHCLAMSQSTSSVWCYACKVFVDHPRLLPLRQRMEAAKARATSQGACLEGHARGDAETIEVFI